MPAGRSCSSPTTWPCKMQSLGSQPIPSLLQPQNLLAQDTSTVPDWFLQKESLLPALCTLSPLFLIPFIYLFISTDRRFRQVLQGTEVSQAPSPAGMEDEGQEKTSLGEETFPEVLVPWLLSLPGTKSCFPNRVRIFPCQRRQHFEVSVISGWKMSHHQGVGEQLQG